MQPRRKELGEAKLVSVQRMAEHKNEAQGSMASVTQPPS